MSGRTRGLAGSPRLLALGLLPALLALLAVPLQARAAPNGYDVVTEYPTSPNTQPSDIITGPDGKIWYVALGSNGATLVKVDPSTGSTLSSQTISNCLANHITFGGDQSLWVGIACYLTLPPPGLQFASSYLVHVTPAGTVTQFDLRSGTTYGSGPGPLASGPDGNIWITESDLRAITKFDVNTSVITHYPSTSPARGIAVGSDGNLWFTEQGFVGRITTSGSIAEYPLPNPNNGGGEIKAGPDGNLYFSEGGGKIGRVTTSGVIKEFTLPTGAAASGVTFGPDGNLWFTESDSNKIGSMTLAGVVQETAVPTPNSRPQELATGPDGNLWFTEFLANQIGKVGARHNALVVDKTAIAFGSVAIGGTTATQRVTLTNTGPDIMAAFPPTTSNAGSPNGSFAVAADTCHLVAVAAGSSCYADVVFNAASTVGSASGALIFRTDSGLATEQSLTVSLSATVVAANCTFTGLSTDLAAPQNVGAVVTLTASSTGCPHPLYQFSFRTPDGVWSILHDFSITTSTVWNTAGYASGTYLIRVWTKDVSSTTASYDAFDTRTFTLLVPGCTSANLASDVGSPQAAGSTINFTATSIGCPTPLYQWWVRDPAGNWTIAPGHDFAHSSATFAWNTMGLAGGTYQVGFWAKQPGSASTYDAYSIGTYTLTVTQCSAVNLATSATSPQSTGSSITLTPTAVGCPSAQYRFWIRDTAGSWRMVQDYGVAGTYVWNNASIPVDTNTAATFLLGVWARQPGSTNAYDAFAFNTFSLISGPTCTVNIAADKPSPQGLGTGATWTATASGCANTPLQFQFWVSPPGGTWGVVQPFGTPTTYVWFGATAGTYQVGVWVRQTGSTAAYDNFAFMTFTLTPDSPPQACQSVNIAASPGSPSVSGTTVTLTASGVVGCSNPQFRWWVNDIYGEWKIVQDYGPANTFTWSSAPSNWAPELPGIYQVGIWVRQTGSTASYEAYSFVTYTIVFAAGAGPCTGATITPALPNGGPADPPPQTVGTPINFTVTTSGCLGGNYRWFTAAPGAAFVETNPACCPLTPNSFIWDTTGLSPGFYQVGVWASNDGSVAHQAYAFITYRLLPITTCTTLTLWPSNGGPANTIGSQPPQPAGLTITWHGVVGGCSAANFKFYFVAPGSSSYVVQTFGNPEATASWSTAGLPPGTYRITVTATANFMVEASAVAYYEVV